MIPIPCFHGICARVVGNAAKAGLIRNKRHFGGGDLNRA
jgi:hypothetical protein